MKSQTSFFQPETFSEFVTRIINQFSNPNVENVTVVCPDGTEVRMERSADCVSAEHGAWLDRSEEQAEAKAV